MRLVPLRTDRNNWVWINPRHVTYVLQSRTVSGNVCEVGLSGSAPCVVKGTADTITDRLLSRKNAQEVE
jgi:hypothetical protein